MMTKLSWKPVRRGVLYCSSACGRGCTVQEFRDAERRALKLAVRLSFTDSDIKKGGKWEIVVHENLGWHFHVTKGAVSVYQHGANRFAACLNISGPWGGNKWIYATTPVNAVVRLLSEARAELKPMVALAKRLSK